MKQSERITIRIDTDTKHRLITKVGQRGFGKYIRTLITKSLSGDK